MPLGEWKRRVLVVLLWPLSRERARHIYRWLRGREAAGRLRRAQVVVVSDAKSGRTWLRVMLSRVYQQRHGLPEGTLLKLDNLHRRAAEVPTVFFTHDNDLGKYLGTRDPAVCYVGKKVVLLVRDPRDVAVSMYFQWTHRMAASKKVFSARDRREMTLSEFVLGEGGKIRMSIDFLNRWAKALPWMPDVFLLRYEDLRQDPARWLGEVLAFMGTPASPQELAEAVAYANLEAMRAREARAQSGTPRRLRPGARENEDSFKTRRGKIGGYRDYFTEEETARLDAVVARRLAPVFGYTKADTEASV
jgi:alcohol sulfotransferase